MASNHFEVQGHRGARGLKPENTLPGFEVAFDLGITSIETDVHLTRDGVPVLIHDAHLPRPIFRQVDETCPPLETWPAVSGLPLAELHGYQADGNPDPARFPDQDVDVTPLAHLFAQQRAMNTY